MSEVGEWLQGLQRDARRTVQEIAKRARLDVPRVETALRGDELLDWAETVAISQACDHTPDDVDRARWERERGRRDGHRRDPPPPAEPWWVLLTSRTCAVAARVSTVVARLAAGGAAVVTAVVAAVGGVWAWLVAHRPWALTGVVAVGLVALMVVLLLARGPVDPTPTIEACSATSVYAELDGVQECVGRVTDVSTMPATLRPVLAAIAGENARATSASASTVSLAYLLPVPAGRDEDSQATVVQLTEELAGVQRAQQQTNHAGAAPPVRVVVYNTGGRGVFWVRVMNDLQTQIATDNHIIAVAGLGPGSGGTGPVSEALTRLGVPVFPSRAYADQLTGLPADPPGLFRLTPTATRLAATAATRLGQGRVVLVQDDRSDNFDAAAFFRALSEDLGRDPADPSRIGYDSSAGSPSTTFVDGLSKRCPPPASGTPTGPQSFAVAGRGPAIIDLLIALDASSCPKPLTVTAGPEGAGVLDEVRLALRGQGDDRARALLDAFRRGTFRFQYVGLVHPDLLPVPFDGVPDPLTLQNGDEILGYDTASTAMSCIRRSGTGPPGPQAVLSSCATTVTAGRPVDGTVGPIGFDAQSRATSAVVPVVEVRADGSAPMIATGP